MRISTIKEILLYRYRYILGYAVVFGLGAALLVWQLADIPPGFTAGEMQSAVVSSGLSLASDSFVNLPYHALQWASLELFGAGIMGVRLGSVVLAALLGLGSYFLLRRWFRESIAVMGTALVVTSVQFLLLGRLGTPAILYSLWPLLLLLCASMANLQGRHWKKWLLAFTAVAALSLYTPFMVILLLVLAAMALLSRQGRVLLNDTGGPFLTTCGFIFVILLVPMGWNIYQHPEVTTAYLGFNGTPTLQLALDRLREFVQLLGDVRPNENTILAPILSLPATVLALWGIVYAARHIARLRYAVLLLWLFASAALFVSVKTLPIAIVFVPVSLLLVIGLWRFIRRWYDIFPRNPYARLAAIGPLALLLLVMVQFNLERYFYGLPRTQNVRALYDGDPLLLRRKLQAQPLLQSGTVVVSPEKQPFFSLLKQEYPNLVVTTANNYPASSSVTVVAETEASKLGAAAPASLKDKSVRYLIDDRPESALRFIMYR